MILPDLSAPVGTSPPGRPSAVHRAQPPCTNAAWKGFDSAYNARRQRVLYGRSPEAVVRERLERDPSLANPGYRPPPDPCVLPKAMLVIERAKDVSPPDS